MRTLIFLLRKEFRQIFRNPTILRMIIAVPIIQLIILPLAADYEIKNINLSIIDHDHSPFSQELIQKIENSNYFKINDYSGSFDEAYTYFQEDASDLILEIPNNFEKDLVVNKKQELFIAVNAINGTKAMVGNNYLNQIVGSFNQSIRTKFIPDPRGKMPPSIQVKENHWYNPFLNYSTFMVPGILVVLVTMVGAYMCALNIVKEKEVGTIEQINVTPIKKVYFILGKLIPFGVIGVLVYSIGLFGVARIIYGIIPVGSIILLYTFLVVYLIAILGIGLIISTYSNTQQQAMSLAFFMMMIFLLMSGLFTSIDSMPEWALWIARANPVTYFIEVNRNVILKGSDFISLKNHFYTLAGMAVFFNTWAILNYKKTI